MTDQTGTSGDPGPDQAEPEEAEGVELRGLSRDELREILEAHEKWLGSNEKEGRQANFSRADLQGADLRGAMGLTQDQLDNSCGDAKTRLPPGLEIEPCEGESGAKN